MEETTDEVSLQVAHSTQNRSQPRCAKRSSSPSARSERSVRIHGTGVNKSHETDGQMGSRTDSSRKALRSRNKARDAMAKPRWGRARATKRERRRTPSLTLR
eukprot:scaffold30516_cov27-Tisochrysis_lutea.AAC.2